MCWKRKMPNLSSENGKKNLDAFINALIRSSDIFSEEKLKEIIDPNDFNDQKVDRENFMVVSFQFNNVVEEYAKIMASDSPYITQFYMNFGFKNVFSLYHWLRALMEKLDSMDSMRVLFAKHVQLVWSNLGDLFATIIEAKFLKDAREAYPLVTELHKTDSEFLCSLFYHI